MKNTLTIPLPTDPDPRNCTSYTRIPFPAAAPRRATEAYLVRIWYRDTDCAPRCRWTSRIVIYADEPIGAVEEIAAEAFRRAHEEAEILACDVRPEIPVQGDTYRVR